MKITLTIDDKCLERLKELSEKTKIPLEKLLETIIEACETDINIVYNTIADRVGLRIEDEEIKLYAAIQQAMRIGAEFYREIIAKILDELDVLGEFVVDDMSLKDNELWLGLACARDSDLNIDWMDITVDIESGEGEIAAYCYLDEDVPDEILDRIERICSGEIYEDEEDEEEYEYLSDLLEEVSGYGGELEVDPDAPAIVFSMTTEDYGDFPSMKTVSDLMGEILEKSGYIDWLMNKEEEYDDEEI